MGHRYKRTRLWVDPAFQFRLLLRIGLYFLLYSVILLHIGFFFHVMRECTAQGPTQRIAVIYADYLRQQNSLFYALIVTAPIILYDLLKFSNRIAGPLYRCRKVMQEMAGGKPVPEFTSRKRDLMRELFQAFNALIKEWNASVRARGNVRPSDARPTDDGNADHLECPPDWAGRVF
jgi:hypothetical protein